LPRFNVTDYSEGKGLERLDKGSYTDCGNDTPAKQTVLCNVDELANAIAEAIGDTGGGSDLKCLRDVFNLTANTPLTITFPAISVICSVEFEDSNGNEIYLSEKAVGNQLTVCSKQDLTNILYKVIGE